MTYGAGAGVVTIDPSGAEPTVEAQLVVSLELCLVLACCEALVLVESRRDLDKRPGIGGGPLLSIVLLAVSTDVQMVNVVTAPQEGDHVQIQLDKVAGCAA
jgi:hypothetical protein